MEVGQNVFLKGVIDDIQEKNGKFTATIIVEGKKVKINDATKILSSPNDLINSTQQLKDYDNQELSQMFNEENVGDVISQFTKEEITDRIEAYKNYNQINAGTIVETERFRYLVLDVKGSSLTCLNLTTYTTTTIKKHLVTKTNQVVNLDSLFAPSQNQFNYIVPNDEPTNIEEPSKTEDEPTVNEEPMVEEEISETMEVEVNNSSKKKNK